MGQGTVTGLNSGEAEGLSASPGRECGGSLLQELRPFQVRVFFAEQPRCTVAMEAGATAHSWAREVTALVNNARLIPPMAVRPLAKCGKSADNDPKTICTTVTRTDHAVSLDQNGFLCSVQGCH
ncbi:MAG: hypothetical protein AAFU49_10600 [Pseudomonadota bacterium]